MNNLLYLPKSEMNVFGFINAILIFNFSNSMSYKNKIKDYLINNTLITLDAV